MSEIINTLFGEGKDLNTLQMADRAFVMFFFTLILIRIAGMRAFGTKSAFDNILVIMLGAVLSRAVAGASPFVPTIVAGLVMVVTHRLLAILAVHNQTIGKLIKGEATSLYKDGMMNEDNMNKCTISKDDLVEGVRLGANVSSLSEIEEVLMERNGKMSIIKKKS